MRTTSHTVRRAPQLESAPLLRALLEGAQLPLLDQLGRGHHLHHPFWDPLGAEPALGGLPELTRVVARLWSLGARAERADVEHALDGETVGELVAGGLLEREGETLSSPWRVVHYLRRSLLVTPPASDAAFDPHAPVAYVGPESLYFAPLVLGAERCERALDLGTGAGLLATLLPARQVTAVELDPFAASIARFNMAMGGHDHVEVREGDLFEPVAGERFDLIVSNPPFLPAPSGVTLPACGDGGADGEQTLRRIVPRLAEHLTPNGQALVYGEGFGGPDEPQLVQWLREQPAADGWDVTVHVTRSAHHERVALRMVALWQACGASEQTAWEAWRAFAGAQPASHQHTFVIVVAPGVGRVTSLRTPRI